MNFLKRSYILRAIALFQIWPLKTSNPDISKSIMVRSFKFGQSIQDDEIILIEKLMVGGTVFHKQNV